MVVLIKFFLVLIEVMEAVAVDTKQRYLKTVCARFLAYRLRII